MSEDFGLDKAISIMKSGGYIGKRSIDGLSFCKRDNETLCYTIQNKVYMPFAFSDTLVWDEDYYEVNAPDV
jgi:hypothetical protein